MNNRIKSLGYRTDFIFNEFDGSVIDKDEYHVATTASNPNYFWGNLLLYKDAPKKGDLQKWKDAFAKEFPSKETYHITLAWDSPSGEEGDCSEFVDDGFSLEKSIVLTAKETHLPPKFNEDVELKVITEEKDFEECIQIQISCGGDYLSKESWEGFYRKQMQQYKLMISKGRGHWFAATLDEKIVGCLGIFTDGDIARYQIVSSSPEFQRRGVCSTLVYKSAEYAFREMGVNTLVMVADEDYHAAQIYESVGFLPTEKQIGVYWWDKTRD